MYTRFLSRTTVGYPKRWKSSVSKLAPTKYDKFGLDDKEDTVELYNKFWNFFQHSAPQIHGIEDMEHPLLQQLADKLQQIDSHLSFEINKGRLYEASLTAKILKVNVLGLRKYCPTAVLSKLGWTVHPFKQRATLTGQEMGTVELKFSEVQFVAYPIEEEEEDEGAPLPPTYVPRIRLSVLVADGMPVSSHISDMVHVMIMAVIGEYDSVTHVGSINFVSEFGEDANVNVFILPQLAQVLDTYLYDFEKKQAKKMQQKSNKE